MVGWEVRGFKGGGVVVGGVVRGGGGGGGLIKCSGVAVLVADLVTQLPELVNLAA